MYVHRVYMIPAQYRCLSAYVSTSTISAQALGSVESQCLVKFLAVFGPAGPASIAVFEL